MSCFVKNRGRTYLDIQKHPKRRDRRLSQCAVRYQHYNALAAILALEYLRPTLFCSWSSELLKRVQKPISSNESVRAFGFLASAAGFVGYHLIGQR